MIVTGVANGNISIVLDLVQAKMLVEVLRHATMANCIDASVPIQAAGFLMMGNDVQGAVQNFITTTGFITDKVSNMPPPQPEATQTAAATASPTTTGTTVN